MKRVEPVTDLRRAEERLETPVQRVGGRSGPGRRLAEVFTVAAVIALLAGAAGLVALPGAPVDRPHEAASSGGTTALAVDPTARPGAVPPRTRPSDLPRTLPLVFLAAARPTATIPARGVALVPGCQLTIAFTETIDDADGCATMLPMQVPNVLEAPAGTPLRIVVRSGSFEGTGAPGSEPVFCGRIIEAGAGVAPDPTCDVRYASAKGGPTFAIHGTGSRRVAITGCAVIDSKSACGVWWAWIRTTAAKP